MKTRASRTSDLSRLRELARQVQALRETERLISACVKKGVACEDLRTRRHRIAVEVDRQVENAFIATKTLFPEEAFSLPD